VQEPRKKRARFSTKDVLEDLRISWIRFGAHLPEIDVLSSALATPLEEHEKLPVSQDTFDRLIHRDNSRPEHNCLEDDLEKIFRVHDTDRIAREPAFTIVFTLSTPSDLGTEDSFHNFWDTLIRNIVAAILSLEERSQN
jgi:hypothetical protein